MSKVPEMLDSLWDRMLTELERRLPASALDSWLRPCRLAALDGDDLTIAAPNKYTRDWLIQNHLGALETAARHSMLVPADRGLRFSHELIARSIYAGIPPARRRTMHRRKNGSLLMTRRWVSQLA